HLNSHGYHRGSHPAPLLRRFRLHHEADREQAAQERFQLQCYGRWPNGTRQVDADQHPVRLAPDRLEGPARGVRDAARDDRDPPCRPCDRRERRPVAAQHCRHPRLRRPGEQRGLLGPHHQVHQGPALGLPAQGAHCDARALHYRHPHSLLPLLYQPV
ncbi:hypothetical protein OC835_008024, partial [Tilletia horrida]